MDARSKATLRFISIWRSLRGLLLPDSNDAPAPTSPLLIFIAVALTIFLAITEIERHRSELAAIGLLRQNGCIMDPTFVGP